MGFLEIRSSIKFLNPPDARAAACTREKPECITLEVEPGVTPSGAPPVRVFLGTEPGQYRAERIFIYSIERNRDPARVYEIHLMKDLVGFDRRGWTTGFTNYRFAIPELAGRTGRAIFNDVDEAYVGDPADLFDAEMGDHGYLATSDTETSVMLIDCARMAPIWVYEDVQQSLKKQVLRRTLAEHPGIRGDLPAEWIARDETFEAGFSKLQHWTVLHTQPWRPVPSRFVYQPNSTGDIWFDMKSAADAEGYQVFSEARPSSQYSELVDRVGGASLIAAQTASRFEVEFTRRLEKALAESKGESLLEVGLGDDVALSSDASEHHRHSMLSPASMPRGNDGVACAGLLEFLPDEDVPWVIDELFASAQRFVCVAVDNVAGERQLAEGGPLVRAVRDLSWWMEHFESSARRHPDLHWSLVLAEPGERGVCVREGGSYWGNSPRVWVLCDERPETTAQALALAESLGWPYERKDLRFEGASSSNSDPESPLPIPAFPDVVISAGGACAKQAQSIREQDLGRTRLVHVGCDGGESADQFDAVVTPAYAHLWPHPNRVESIAPLTRAGDKSLTCSGDAAEDLFADIPGPHVVLLVDSSATGRLEAAALQQMASDVNNLAVRLGATAVAAVGSKLGSREYQSLGRGLEDEARVRRMDLAADPNALLAVIAGAERVVVSGNHGSLVAQAAASASCLEIYPIEEHQFWLMDRTRVWVEEVANTRPLNARGTARPQQGLEYLCARLIEQGRVIPRSKPNELHQELYRRGIARPFGATADRGAPGERLRDADEVARRVRALLGHPEAVDR